MAAVLKKMGKMVVVVNDDRLPDWLGFLPGSKNFKKRSEEKLSAFDAVIVLGEAALE